MPYGPILLLSCWEKIVWLVQRPNRWVTQLTDIVSQTFALTVRDSARNRCGENLGKRVAGRWHPDFYWEEIQGECYRNEIFTRKHSIQCLSSHPSTLMIPVLRIIWWQEAEAIRPHCRKYTGASQALKNWQTTAPSHITLASFISMSGLPSFVVFLPIHPWLVMAALSLTPHYIPIQGLPPASLSLRPWDEALVWLRISPQISWEGPWAGR